MENRTLRCLWLCALLLGLVGVTSCQGGGNAVPDLAAPPSLPDMGAPPHDMGGSPKLLICLSGNAKGAANMVYCYTDAGQALPPLDTLGAGGVPASVAGSVVWNKAGTKLVAVNADGFSIFNAIKQSPYLEFRQRISAPADIHPVSATFGATGVLHVLTDQGIASFLLLPDSSGDYYSSPATGDTSALVYNATVAQVVYSPSDDSLRASIRGTDTDDAKYVKVTFMADGTVKSGSSVQIAPGLGIMKNTLLGFAIGPLGEVVPYAHNTHTGGTGLYTAFKAGAYVTSLASTKDSPSWVANDGVSGCYETAATDGQALMRVTIVDDLVNPGQKQLVESLGALTNDLGAGPADVASIPPKNGGPGYLAVRIKPAANGSHSGFVRLYETSPDCSKPLKVVVTIPLPTKAAAAVGIGLTYLP